ncbi:MAG: hypothetical protein ACOYD1_12795 [Candidatus Nanopelagicales bacterium]
MAKTAVVNKRRRRRRRNPASATANPRRSRRRRRRRNYGPAAAVNPRRRRRSHGMSRRRRNPVSPYSSTSYYRRPNPSFDVMTDITEVMPAGTAGIWLSRFALKQAGAFEPDAKGVLEPGIKHALAIYLAASMGSELVGSVLGQGKAQIAKIAALSFGGDLFLRTRFMKDSEFVKNNLSLQGMGYDDDEPDQNGYYVPDGMEGFQDQSALGSTMVDAFGNRFVSTPEGWQLAGVGDAWQMGAPAGVARLAGFATHSPLGNVGASSANSFGYAPR